MIVLYLLVYSGLMLSAEQYESLGKVTLTFNHLELTIQSIIASYLGHPESEMAQAVAMEGMFRQKATRLDHMIKAFQERYPDRGPEADSVRQLLKAAIRLAERRNAYVHALTIHNYKENVTKLLIKGIETACDRRELEQLDSDMQFVAFQLGEAAIELLPKKTPTKPVFGESHRPDG